MNDFTLSGATTYYTPPQYNLWTYNGTNVVVNSVSFAGNNGVGWTKWNQAAGVGGGFGRYIMDLGTAAKVIGA